MQKKILLGIMGILMLLVAGCGPFNTKAKVTYASHTTTGTTLADKMIKITVTLGNSVYIDNIEEVNATVNGATSKLKFIDAKLDDTNKVINVYALQGADSTTQNAITIKDTNTVVINSIKCKDENDNTITVSGLELMGTIKLSSSSDTSSTTLTAVSGLAAELKTTSTGYAVKLSWTASSTAKSGYRVYITETDNGKFNEDEEKPEDFTTTGTGITTSLTYYTDTQVEEGKTYFYRVTAYDGVNETPKQDIAIGKEITGTSTGTVTVPKVTKLTVEPDVDSVLLEWAEVSASSTGTEIIGYNIYASSTVAGEYKKLTTRVIDGVSTTATTPNALKITRLKIGSNSIFTDNSLKISSASPLYIKVAAVEFGGIEGEKSTSVYATMYDSNVPILQSSSEIKLVPYGNTDDFSDTKLGAKIEWVNKTATWGTSESVTKYIIERTNDLASDFTEITTVAKSTGTKTSYIDGSFMELKNKTAYYRIRCVSSTGAIGRPSGSVEVKDEPSLNPPDITLPEKMLVLTGIAVSGANNVYTFDYIKSDGNAAVAEVPADDFAGYKIYMSNTFDGEYVLAGKVGELWGAEVTVANTIINPTKPIYVRVSSYDYFGNESGLSLRTSDLN